MSREQPRARDDRGSVLVEFSLVFVVFVFVAYALVGFGMAINLKQNLTHAVNEGARAAIGAGGGCDVNDADPAAQTSCRDAKRAAAVSHATEDLAGQSGNVKQEATSKISAVIAPCTGSTATCITVSIPYDYKSVPIIPSAPGLGVVMPDTLRAMSVVQLSS